MRSISKSLFCFSRPAVAALSFAMFLLLSTVLEVSSSAQDSKYDLGNWLSKRDTNKSGVLEPNELSDSDKNFLNKMDIDTSSNIVITDVLRKSRAAREKFEKEKSDREFASKKWEIPGFGEPVEKGEIPGFGVEAAKEEEAEVPSFEVDEETRKESMVSIREQFGRRINGRVESVFRDYDKDKNGVLDPSEISAVPWRNPPWQDFDENRDRQLTKVELAKRYKAAEDGDDDDRSDGRSQSSRRGPGRPPSNDRSTSNDDSRDRGSRGTSSASTTSASAYARSTMKKKDLNGNGKIDGDEEWKSIGILRDADADGNKEITMQELVAFSSGKKTTSSGRPSERSNSAKNASIRNNRSGSRSNEASRRSERSRNSRSQTEDRILRDGNAQEVLKIPEEKREPFSEEAILNRRAKTPRDFKSKDRNGDGMIQLTEFTSEITRKSIEDFRAADSNNDGVISPAEWEDQ